MGSVISRSGIPRTVDGTVSASATIQEATIIADTPTTWLSVENTDGANGLKVYFTAADFTADRSFVRVKPGDHRDFPVELFGAKGLFLRCDNVDPAATATFSVVYAQRVL